MQSKGNPLRQNRLGRVVVTGEMFHYVEAMALLMTNFIPCRCEYRFTTNDFEYIGYSRHFAELTPGEEPPTYSACFYREQDLLSFEPITRFLGFV